MTKILLVEDDNALREIYGTRLVAEGYDVVSAADGEAALAMAIKEHPDLILSDIMMPKVSGFEMIDILKSTTETKGIKIVVMTALSNDSQRERGESLGVDRYLVKSQVGIEDVVDTVRELLSGATGASPAQPTTPAPNPSVAAEALSPEPEPAPTPTPTTPAAPAAPAVPTPAPVSAPPAPAPAAPAPLTMNEQGMVDENQLDLSSSGKKVIQPLDTNLTLSAKPEPLTPATDLATPAPEAEQSPTETAPVMPAGLPIIEEPTGAPDPMAPMSPMTPPQQPVVETAVPIVSSGQPTV
jgi:CheY-like chemotaxis protein